MKKFAPSILFLFLCFSVQAQMFTAVTTGEVFNDSLALGGAWGDFDNDGFEDLFNSQYQLYHNNGDGTFDKLTDDVVAMTGIGIGATCGDFDNDGFLDLYTASPNVAGGGRLFHNNTDGTFSQILDPPFTTDSSDFQVSSWVDFDNDGDLDLYATAGGNVGFSNNFLYENLGNGTFANLSTSILTQDSSGTINCSWGDYNRDGHVDLFIANGAPGIDASANRLYTNNGDGTFTRITSGPVVENAFFSLGSSWGDYNNDGYIDLFVANEADNELYQNNGDGTFSAMSGPVTASNLLSVGSAWGDYDNDGDLDLVVANLSSNCIFYRNDGNGIFIPVNNEPFFAHGAFGVSSADWDKDGDLDLLFNRSSTNNHRPYLNNGNGNDWLNIHCVGVISNTSAIGAKVWVNATVNGEETWQLREISGQTGSLGQSSLNAHFGLGAGGSLDSVMIEWPSGTVQVLTGISPNQHIEVVEDTSIVSTGEVLRRAPVSNFEIFPNPASDWATLTFQLEENLAVRLTIVDATGREVAHLREETFGSGVYQEKIKVDQLASGTYFCRLQVGGGFVFSKRFVVER